MDALSAELEEERRQNEEIQKQMQFVEALIARMKKMEEQASPPPHTHTVTAHFHLNPFSNTLDSSRVECLLHLINYNQSNFIRCSQRQSVQAFE